MAVEKITVPNIGDFDEVEVIEVLVSVGDVIVPEDSLITVESDKASMEIPAPSGGKVVAISVAVGDTIKQEDLILDLETDASSSDSAPATPEADDTPEVEDVVEEPAPEPEPALEQAVAPEQAPEATSLGGVELVMVPDIGDFDAVEVIEVLVGSGDTVAVEDSLITVESDKASMEIPSPHAGVIKTLNVSVGDTIKQGDAILEMNVASAAAQAPAAAAAPAAASTPEAKVADKQEEKGPRPSPTDKMSSSISHPSYATPTVRKFARELGVDLTKVVGTGNKTRILKDDVKKFTKQVMSSGGGNSLGIEPMPEIDFSEWGEVESLPLTKINKLTGKFLTRNYLTVPHVTQFDEADITRLNAFRKEMSAEQKDSGVKVTLLAFLVKAVVTCLREYPRFNSSLDASQENLILKKYFNVGIAVDTSDGLVVPVVKDADRKSLLEIAAELGEISEKARNKALRPSDMKGASMSISSLGGIGGTKFTPIVNLPEVAILGVSRSKMQPVWDGEEFKPRLILPLSLSYDHRVIDGADAARFTTMLSKVLSDTRRLLL